MAAKEFIKIVLKTIGVAVGLTVIFMIGVFVSGLGQSVPAASSAAAPNTQQTGNILVMLFLASLIQAAVVSYLVLESKWKSWKLTGALALVVLNVWVQTAIEAGPYLRGRISPNFTTHTLIMGLVTAALFAPFAVWVLGGFGKAGKKEPGETFHWSATRWIGTLAATLVVFVALYYLCGYYIAWQNPALRQFYAGSIEIKGFWAQIASIWSSTPWMFPWQAGRGLIFIVMTLPAVLLLRGGVGRVTFGTALMYATWDGSVGLMIPNPIMPPTVAYTHLVETAVWGLLFGACVGWLMSQGRRPAVSAKELPKAA